MCGSYRHARRYFSALWIDKTQNSALPVETLDDSTERSTIKFEDGTLIQKRRFFVADTGSFQAWGNSELYYKRFTLGTFLTAFSNTPAITLGVESTSNVMIGNTTGLSKTSAGEIVLSKVTSEALTNVALDYIAIGRWK